MISKTTIVAWTWPPVEETPGPEWHAAPEAPRMKKRTVSNRIPRRTHWDEALDDLHRQARNARRGTTDALLTVREDALKIRKAVLEGDREAALAGADWLVDCIDEYLSEG